MKPSLPYACLIPVLLFSGWGCTDKKETTAFGSVAPQQGEAPASAARAEQNAEQDLLEDATTAVFDGIARRTAGGAKPDDERQLSEAGGIQLRAGQSIPFAKELSGRQLEYQIRLEYRATDPALARQFLFTFIEKYGFAMQSRTEEAGRFQYVLRIRTEKLVSALAELDGLGELQSERIDTIDHTEAFMQESLKQRRNQIRSLRRGQNLQPGTLGAAQREEQLAASEDAEDEARLALWRIGDRVQWATLHLELVTPASAALRVPIWQEALKGSLQATLQVLYYLLYLWPLFLLILAYRVWRWRTRRSQASRLPTAEKNL